MSKLIDFLKSSKEDEKQLAYALTDGWEVLIYDPKEEGKILLDTDLHSVLHDTMRHYGLEDQSP